MRKRDRKKLALHRESLRGLDLAAVAGGVTQQVDCSFVVTCTQAATCTGAANCATAGVDCSFVVTGCTTA